MEQNILYAGFSKKGSISKLRDVCQDKFYCKVNDNFVFLSVADGASVAKYSDIGASIVIKNTYEIVRSNFDEYYESTADKIKTKIITILLQKLNSFAIMKKTALKEFASTLVFIALKDDKIIAGHIGDGLIAYKKLDEYKILSPPLNGEFINQTYFVTSKNYLAHFRIYKGESKDINKLFLMTDGMTHLYYNRKDNILNERFINEIGELASNSSFELNASLKYLLFNKLANQIKDDSTIVTAIMT